MQTATRYVLVTGASSGIGAAFARRAARDGCSLGLVARRRDRLEALAQELLDKHQTKVDVFVCDLSQEKAGETLALKLKAKKKSVDILINNAGMSLAHGLVNTTAAQQRAFIELTVQTPVALAQALIPEMLRKGFGRIINISSITALSSGGKGHTLYPAGKAFLLKFSQSLNAELCERGVCVSAVLPGFVKTEFLEANGMAEKMAKTNKDHRASGQRPEDLVQEVWRRMRRGDEIIVPGFTAKCMAVALRYLPERLTRWIIRREVEKVYVGD